MRRERLVDFGLIGLIGVLWGLNWPAVKVILGEIPPFTMRAVAFALGACLLACLAWARGESLAVPRRERWALWGAGFLTVFGFNVATSFGQLFTETSKAAIIAFTMPVWATLMSAAWLGEPLDWRRIVSVGLGVLGLLALLGENVPALIEDPRGAGFMLIAALSWAAGTVWLKRGPGSGSELGGGVWSTPPIARTAVMLAVSTPPTVLGAFAFEAPLALAAPSWGVIAVFAYHVAFPMVVCYAAWTIMVARLSASAAAIGTLLIPVVGVISSVILLGDGFGPMRALALALVLAAIAVGVARRRAIG